jgi:hypothetical protein
MKWSKPGQCSLKPICSPVSGLMPELAIWPRAGAKQETGNATNRKVPVPRVAVLRAFQFPVSVSTSLRVQPASTTARVQPRLHQHSMTTPPPSSRTPPPRFTSEPSPSEPTAPATTQTDLPPPAFIQFQDTDFPQTGELPIPHVNPVLAHVPPPFTLPNVHSSTLLSSVVFVPYTIPSKPVQGIKMRKPSLFKRSWCALRLGIYDTYDFSMGFLRGLGRIL